MGRIDWNITGPGGQAIVDEGGSKRCRLSASKLMLWNGRNDFADSEIEASILMAVDTNTRGGLVLRSDLSANNCYRLRIFGARTYYIQRILAGSGITLATAYSQQPYNIYVKTRFRIDGFQLSVQEYFGGQWNLISAIVDTDQALASGYAGLYGESVNTSYFITFDDVTIGER